MTTASFPLSAGPTRTPRIARTHIDSRGSRPGRRIAPARLDASVYLQRRLVAGVVLMVLGALLWTMATWATNSSIGVSPVGADRSGLATEVYVVQPGDTLWSIAATIDTDGDVRDTVDMLAALNGGSSLRVGQRLTVGS